MPGAEPDPVFETQPPVAPGAPAPLEGVRVIEIGRFAAGPACATILADWGAEVIKIEPPDGDPARGPGTISDGGPIPINPRFEVHNRSRRSIALDLRVPQARALADRLLGSADVLVTNLSPGALRRLSLDAATLRARHARLIVAQISGYGLDTPLGDERSYDHGGYWAYSGAAALFAARTGQPPQPAGGFGDRAAGSMLAGAIVAALYSRERTGQGCHLSTSLVNTGLWLMASDVSDVLATGRAPRANDRRLATIPTVNCFRTADARWLWLQVMVPSRDWTQLLSALDAHWLDEDPRFRGGEASNLQANRAPLIELLDEIFRERTLAEWSRRLDASHITWAPVRTLEETVGDAAVRSSSAVVRFVDEFDQPHISVNSPCLFDGVTPRPATRAPEAGEHTEDVLAELGLAEVEIDELRRANAIGRRAPDAAQA